MFDRVNGTDTIRKQFQSGIKAEEIVKSYQGELKEFIEKRKNTCFMNRRRICLL
jgi:uncharacterized protein YbbC (DUF1343 family)